MNGIIVVDKPQDFTSFDVVAKMRGICQTRKIGHGGTLDPMATGVLPVFVGRAVKAVDMQPRQDKTYEAQLLFGVSTDTGDITGTVLEEQVVNIGKDQLMQTVPAFLGDIMQLPPMYSAVKINGKPLYRYAREGKTVERKTRPVTIHEIQYLGGECNRHTLRVHCSKGTYIRTLAEDLGKALGVPATLAALRRTSAGVFSEKDCYTFEQIQQARDQGCLDHLFLSVEKVFEETPLLQLAPGVRERLYNGSFAQVENVDPGRYRGSDDEGFLGLVEVDETGTLRAEKILCNR